MIMERIENRDVQSLCARRKFSTTLIAPSEGRGKKFK